MKMKSSQCCAQEIQFLLCIRFTEEKSLKLSSKTLFDLYIPLCQIPSPTLLYSVQFTEVILLNFGETAKNLGAHSNINNFFVSNTITDQEQEVRMRDLTISLIIVKCSPRIQTHYKH